MPKFLEDKLRAEYGNNVSWAAGLFEGEGSVSKRYVAVTQKDLWCLNKLQAIFGGTVGNLRQDGTSQWWICGEKAREFVADIYPLLSPRRKEQICRIFLTFEKLELVKLQHSVACRERIRLRSRDAEGRLT